MLHKEVPTKQSYSMMLWLNFEPCFMVSQVCTVFDQLFNFLKVCVIRTICGNLFWALGCIGRVVSEHEFLAY